MTPPDRLRPVEVGRIMGAETDVTWPIPRSACPRTSPESSSSMRRRSSGSFSHRSSPHASWSTSRGTRSFRASRALERGSPRLASREGLSVTSFRMFSVYGPGQNLGNLKQGMASIYLAYLLRGEPVPVTGSLERFRDFVYIDDAVEAWMAALALGETTSPVYNVGSGSRTTVRELLAALKAALGLRPDHPVQENPGSPSDQFGIWADIRRIAKELQWRPTIPLEVGLRRMVAWAVERATPEGRW